MEKEKFRISIIDFLPYNGKYPIGNDKNGNVLCIGDMVEYNGENNWFLVYRYGKILLKQVGMMAMIGNDSFEKNDFTSLEKRNTIGAGNDWLIIGYTDEPFYETVKHMMCEL